ncbi:ESX secretion-associated protein EspG [Crossiella sp. CA-258035]|uniref:ESX secretion-associated protein EspG n=1 Tax=Crossiella sp. CA-258035 TaxID=2981138 RepID=UPI0024BBFB09|nr:ESX secretion-associated protein EspG [Crossiella sp. CA-258035]WHT18332.1 ESX secretion-associated protein EspG [Crossiella sp. CA-258035]
MTVSLDLELNALEFEVLWEHLRLGDKPTELNTLSHGVTDEERAHFRRLAWSSLEQRGRAEDGRLDVELEDLLILLARPNRSIDIRFSWRVGEQILPEVKALCSAVGDTGVLAVHDGDRYRFGWVRSTGLAPAAAGLLPQPPPGRVGSVTVAADVLESAVSQAADQGKVFVQILTSRGVRQEDAQLLWEIGDADRTLYAQFGATARDQYGRSLRASSVLNVFDIQAGRIGSRERNGWINFFGVDNRKVAEQLDSLLAEVVDR